LLDPYIMLDDDTVNGLLKHFHEALTGAGFFADVSSRSGDVADHRVFADFANFRKAFLEAGLQRVMQALGAYCFLSRVKGIAEFSGHIPAGEARLRWLIRETGETWKAVLPGE